MCVLWIAEPIIFGQCG